MTDSSTTYGESANDVHASVMIQRLIEEVSDEPHFTFGWLIQHLPGNSFGFIILFLSLLSVVPIIDFPARILLLILFTELMFGYRTPTLPRKFLARQWSVRYLISLERTIVPMLARLENVVSPRWQGFLVHARRPTAFVAFLLTIISLIIPVPFANFPIAAVCGLMALAYIEHDGLLLCLALSISTATLSLLLKPFLH